MQEGYAIEVEGKSGLIQENPDSRFAEKNEEGNIPPEEMLYTNGDGEIYQPAEHFEQMLSTVMWKLNRKYCKYLKGFLFVEPEKIVHENQKWEAYETDVVIDNSRVRKARPILPEWALKFQMLNLRKKDLPMNVLKNALEAAGMINGLGGDRPQKGGKHGRFEVTTFEKDPELEESRMSDIL